MDMTQLFKMLTPEQRAQFLSMGASSQQEKAVAPHSPTSPPAPAAASSSTSAESALAAAEASANKALESDCEKPQVPAKSGAKRARKETSTSSAAAKKQARLEAAAAAAAAAAETADEEASDGATSEPEDQASVTAPKKVPAVKDSSKSGGKSLNLVPDAVLKNLLRNAVGEDDKMNMGKDASEEIQMQVSEALAHVAKAVEQACGGSVRAATKDTVLRCWSDVLPMLSEVKIQKVYEDTSAALETERENYKAVKAEDGKKAKAPQSKTTYGVPLSRVMTETKAAVPDWPKTNAELCLAMAVGAECCLRSLVMHCMKQVRAGGKKTIALAHVKHSLQRPALWLHEESSASSKAEETLQQIRALLM